MPLNIGKLRENYSTGFNWLRNTLLSIDIRKIQKYFAARVANKGSSLANRILLLQFVWTIFIYILVITALWFATNLVVESSVRHQGEGWIGKLDELGIPIYAADNKAQLKKAIASLSNFPEIARAKYLDVTGKNVLAEYTRKGGLLDDFTPLTDELIKELGKVDVERKTLLYEKSGNSQMHISAPIWVKSVASDGMVNFSMGKKSIEKVETIGFIELVLDYGKITHELNRNIFNASIFIALIMLAAAFVVRAMVRRALLPLSRLEEPLTRLANGETDVTVNTSGDKEISRIGVALNTTINALKERDDALRRLAVHDSLTGLVNRAFFVDRLDQEIKRVARGGASGALFFFDLDRFKNINDTYGHAAGDRLLVQVAKQLGSRVRENDVFARYGGDEFILLACNVDQRNVHEIAESFIALMREFTFYEAGDMLKIYFSVGVTLINDGSLTVQEFLKEADTAVHQAKTQGRNCFRIFSRDEHVSIEEAGVGWHERLQEVLRKQQAILYYQPMIGLKGQRENTYEVLLRLPDTEQQVISPGAFMSAAERFGLMAEFDIQVISKAAQKLSELKNPQVVFSVNLSEQFFMKEDIPGFLEATISSYNIEPRQFMFELSQSYIVRNIEKLQNILSELTRSGYRFAIDDFGADFGSFNYIKKFPVHLLKIDGSLIEQITKDNIAKATVRAIVEVATELNMHTIAKNVADEDSIVLLRELGVGYIQGNFIAAPSPKLNSTAHEHKESRRKSPR